MKVDLLLNKETKMNPIALSYNGEIHNNDFHKFLLIFLEKGMKPCSPSLNSSLTFLLKR